MGETNLQLPTTPPDWSLNLGEVGRILVILAALLYGVSILSYVLGIFIKQSTAKLENSGALSFNLAGFGLLATFGILGILFVQNRFEFEYVWSHSDLRNAIPYRIAGIWSGQEGSFLLWGCASAIFGMLAAPRVEHYRKWFTIAYAVFLGAITNILVFESPFRLNMMDGKAIVPPDGAGLSPSLQNYWVTIHPPTIFLGFGSLTVLFALAFAALAMKDMQRWAAIIRPWAIVSLTLVGVGLCMGGFWAYETLGWGGFWMWDPVENVSFVPWCMVAALTHGILVQVTKGKWTMTNLALAGLPFVTFVYGTFLTRSGFLADASVHSFAQMDRSALKLLVGVMSITTIGFVGLWIVRAIQAKSKNSSDSASATKEGLLRRESFYAAGVASLLALGLATAIGMSVPLFMALSHKPPKVVSEGIYHQVLAWVFPPIMVLMAIAPFVSWRSMPIKELGNRVYYIVCITIGLVGVSLLAVVSTPYSKLVELAPVLTMFGSKKVNGLGFLLFMVGLCYFVLVGNVWRIAEIWKRSKLGAGPFLAHMGVALLMAGMIVSRGMEMMGDTVVMANHPGNALGMEFKFKGLTSTMNDRENEAILEVTDRASGKPKTFIAKPGVYDVSMADGQKSTMVWPAIRRGFLQDVYVSLKPPQQQQSEEMNVPLGQSVVVGKYVVTYKKMVREGEFGQTGTKFGAQLLVTDAKGTTRTLLPMLELGTGAGPKRIPAKLDDQMEIMMVGMNAADQSVNLQVSLSSLVYPIEVFRKPMTSLVWFGTGVMTLGGIITAFYRRKYAPTNPARTQPEVGASE